MPDLVRRARRGDRAALELLLDAALTPIYRFVAIRVAPGPAVDDVVQETFLAAMSSISALRGDDDAAFTKWLLGIARFKVADHHREQYRRPTDSLAGEDTLAESISVGVESVEDVVMDRARSTRLREELRNLTPEQEEVLTLRYVMGYDNHQVAAITGRNVGAVKALQHRALGTLERRLSAADQGWM